MDAELILKSMLYWAISILSFFALRACIRNIKYYKAKDRKMKRKITVRDAVGVSATFLCMVLYMYFGAIPYTLDAYLYSNNLCPIENAKVVKVVYYNSGRGYGNFSKRGYVTRFLVNGKLVKLKVERKLVEDLTYRIQYLPYTKYVYHAW